MRCHTTLDDYILQGKVPEAVMLGGTSDISLFFQHGFYDWFMFRDELIKYPDEISVLGRYLVPAIYVGPEMTAMILKVNREVVH